uniref:Peptidase M48 domain-containing protein n=1 Tax=Ascaris lumbricoides TaxID=6252 RepID=A0A0M3I4Z5_ASCLU
MRAGTAFGHIRKRFFNSAAENGHREDPMLIKMILKETPEEKSEGIRSGFIDSHPMIPLLRSIFIKKLGTALRSRSPIVYKVRSCCFIKGITFHC